ncbi:bifunctional diaminohydroxyphosphoribosylaminopyrimidine deaminase/5-amino-6-(5-phosphoribosylamino)uracil reductase RibD [Roseivirga misakiensis]|uniref:Riboflavin biosynthesis protein RibD n=1 Tax=Roseivirga misakiensis TaxID=1563681 RepID=A0A1E5T380_9BACT|nr:bifunctional diaminohydroxyphosphoribosylaminopyrimidine deaminase/5-amino-6-(5-phosphoribosylamino)uracil reductase RibD [Roseivirga misakiensis]OEK05848.1 riboflavin biosynthesis protein RibD [Roseivirga misakiensis]
MDKIKYMRRALELAELGRGTTSPNPMVGCVIVHNDQIIGEGFTQPYGQAHAEVMAIRSVENEKILPEATAFVTLEPCSHHGKTPPCADLLISKGLKQVVIGTVDNNPLVGGQGIAKMKEAGIAVEVGILEEECRAMNIRFFTALEKKRPYVILKWAQTADGFVARDNFDSKWISGSASRALVHQWRAHEDAIMVGTNTAKYDNPRLNVRGWEGKDPVRVVIDKKLQLSKDLNLFDGQQPTLVYNELEDHEATNLSYIKVDSSDYVNFILRDLNDRKIQSIIIEGGSGLLDSFINLNLWDEARVFTAPKTFTSGIKAPIINRKSFKTIPIEEDTLDFYRNSEPSELLKS